MPQVPKLEVGMRPREAAWIYWREIKFQDKENRSDICARFFAKALKPIFQLRWVMFWLLAEKQDPMFSTLPSVHTTLKKISVAAIWALCAGFVPLLP